MCPSVAVYVTVSVSVTNVSWFELTTAILRVVHISLRSLILCSIYVCSCSTPLFSSLSFLVRHFSSPANSSLANSAIRLFSSIPFLPSPFPPFLPFPLSFPALKWPSYLAKGFAEALLAPQTRFLASKYAKMCAAEPRPQMQTRFSVFKANEASLVTLLAVNVVLFLLNEIWKLQQMWLFLNVLYVTT